MLETVNYGRLKGNPNDPLSEGRLCPRGTGGTGAHFDPDRIRTPLIRTRERGEEYWKSVTWSEAFDYIANKMNAIKEKFGPNR